MKIFKNLKSYESYYLEFKNGYTYIAKNKFLWLIKKNSSKNFHTVH